MEAVSDARHSEAAIISSGYLVTNFLLIDLISLKEQGRRNLQRLVKGKKRQHQ